jgi:hypothetical protein
MEISLSLFCKSHRLDLSRVVRLAHSIKVFNLENLPFFVSVPVNDIQLFREYLNEFTLTVLSDEEIISKNSLIDLTEYRSIPGNISQQIVKSEFWRMNLSDAYMCLDSDALFIRPFRRQDYLFADGLPYTVIDEGQEFLSFALLHQKAHIVEAYLRDTQKVQQLFDRRGRIYSFGPFPVLWHRAVWESLDLNYLRPNGMNIMDALQKIETESHWYGEALLKYKAIPLMPCQPLFKVYHYAWQLDKDKAAGMDVDKLSKLYSGIIYQSAWEREMDWPSEGGKWPNHLARRLRRALGRI